MGVNRNVIAKGATNHASKAYEFSHFMTFLELVHSQQPLAGEGKNISSTYFTVYTSIVDPIVSVYEIDIQGDSAPNLVPTPKRAARKMTRNSSNIEDKRLVSER